MLVFGFSFIPEEARFDEDEVDSSVVNLVTDSGVTVWGAARSPQCRALVRDGEQVPSAALREAAMSITADLSDADTPPGVRTAVCSMPDLTGSGPQLAMTVARQFATASFHGDAMRNDAEGFIEALQLTNPLIREEYSNAYLPRHLGGRRDVDVVRALGGAEKPLLLEGPPGSGKTTLCREAFGQSLLVVQCSHATTIGDIVGVNQPSGDSEHPFTWVDGPLLEAMLQGRPVLFDDIGALHPGVQTALHSVCDARRSIDVIDRPGGGHIAAAAGFSVVATLNPGEGHGITTPMRNRMSVVLTVPTDLSVARNLRVPAVFVDVAERLERRAEIDRESGLTPWVPSLRELVGARDVAEVFDNHFAALALVSKCPEGTGRDAAIAEFRHHFGEDFAAGGVLVSGGHYDTVPATW